MRWAGSHLSGCRSAAYRTMTLIGRESDTQTNKTLVGIWTLVASRRQGCLRGGVQFPYDVGEWATDNQNRGAARHVREDRRHRHLLHDRRGGADVSRPQPRRDAHL